MNDSDHSFGIQEENQGSGWCCQAYRISVLSCHYVACFGSVSTHPELRRAAKPLGSEGNSILCMIVMQYDHVLSCFMSCMTVTPLP